MEYNENTAANAADLEDFKNECPVVRMHTYPVTGGILNESFTAIMKENVRSRRVDFEFLSRDVYLAYPRSWHIVDMFMWMYAYHPLRHHKFAPTHDGIVFPMSVMCFKAEGVAEIASLRSWMGEILIPLIWPDLRREGMKIVMERRARVTNPESLEELFADGSYLGKDPTSLSFYKRSIK